jgi:FkbM family methyltransferase
MKAALQYVLFKKLPKESRIVETEMGTFDLRKGTTDFQFVNWTYEKEIKNYIKLIIDHIGLFVDVGACIGEYSIWLASKGIKCVTIEPVNHAAIETNLSLNLGAEEHITLYKCAVGKENRRVGFTILEGVTSSSYMSPEEGNIECKRLDDILHSHLEDITKMVLIKLDIEGMEIEALEGAVKSICRLSKLQIIYEHTSCGDRNIRAILEKYGEFVFMDLDGVNTLAIKKQPF